MRLDTCLEYQDSGIDWMGLLPKEWQLVPFFSRFTQQARSNKGMHCDNLLSLSYGRVVTKDINTSDGLLPESFETYQIVEPGDIVFRLTDLQNDKRSLRSAIVEEMGIITSAYLAVKPLEMESRYAHYLFRAYDHTKVFYSMGGGLRQSMKFDDMKRLPVICPPTDEQTQIARFLDHEVGKIDALITEQEKLIALLKEKRQAVISQAVTKGLNPAVPMKDSGVDWLGEVPEHWDVNRIKFVTQVFEQGWSPQCESEPVESGEEFGVLKVGCVNGGIFRSEENKKLPSELEPIKALSLKADDLLISRANTRELVGSAAVVPVNFDNLLLCDKLYRLRLFKNIVVPQFLSFFLSTDLVRTRIETEATGASQSMLNISQSTINNLYFPCPSIEEQLRIVGYVVKQQWQILQLVADARALTNLLNERRSALISAAVTGKIDIRGWQTPVENINPANKEVCVD
ncbi:restriction endonuclease subunit S [Arsukibacterium perlucidum]|uniref:restriction endonuclease subunit S n=1 Tax=Arsukibacterium perlucidum TaxID=368811 RepID=UPI00037E190B|nr:restriction endonuclease subunit S [Arsukibacterium perlucidum]